MVNGNLQQTIAAVSANFFIIGDGLHYGWTAPIVPILKSEESPLPYITDGDITIMEMMYLVGGLCALPLILYIPDKIGRKYSIVAAIVLNFVSWCLIAAIPNIYAYFLARFLGGMTADMGYVSIPMYIAEISHQSLRGFFTGFVCFGVIIGIILIYSVGPFLSIAASASVGIAINFIAFILLCFMPESPYYLIKKNRLEDAEKSLRYFRGNTDVSEELANINSAVTRQESEKGRFVDLFKDRGNRKALIIMIIVSGSPNFAGMTVVVMNINEILSHHGGLLSPELSSILSSIVMLISISIALTIVDKFGRTLLLTTSSILTATALVLLATYSYLEGNNFDVAKLNWLPLFSILLYTAALRFGLGFVPLILNGEIYPTKVKAKGMIFADLTYLITGNVTIYVFQILRHYFGLFVPLYLFAFCCVLIAIYSFGCLLETKGKTLEEIQIMLKGDNVNK